MKRLAALSAALLLSGCAGFGPGQPAVSPLEVALPPAFTLAPDASAETDLMALLPVGDPAFEALRAQALGVAPDLQAALARIDAARALATRAGAERLPQVDASGGVAAQRQNVGQFGPASDFVDATQTTLNAGVSARWDVDLFGQLRARERAAVLRIDSASAEASAVRLALVAEVAAAVTDWRTLQRREAALRSDLRAATDLARLAGVRERAGLSPGTDRVRAEALAAQSRSRLVSLDAERAQVAGRLVALTGQGLQPIAATLNQPAPAAVASGVPAALPSVLLSRRPDVLAAGARLRAADADLAVAAAARFPRLSLSAGLGLLAFGLGGLFDTDAIIGNLGANVAAPLLDFGRLRADEARARAGTAEALAGYRGSVFRALSEAESGYALIAALGREVSAAREQQALQERSARLVDVRYRAGLTNFLDVLEARRAGTGAAEAVAATEGRLARARVLLWQALGGSELSAI
jgi:NodT family efflux transporter outer membrane factor (OMF) lipoprotein